MQKDVEKTPGELVVAISSRALFDLEEEHRLFEEKGYSAFRDFQLAHKRDVLKPGVAFPFVRRLLSLNDRFAPHRPLRVVVCRETLRKRRSASFTPADTTNFRSWREPSLRDTPPSPTSVPSTCRSF